MGEIMGGHFVQSGKRIELGDTSMRTAITELQESAKEAREKALTEMPKAFAHGIHKSIAAAIAERLPHLASALDEL